MCKNQRDTAVNPIYFSGHRFPGTGHYNLQWIIECYGTGPSLGFIIEGRVGKDNFTSLSGSLAPANTINNIVRGIPIIGKVLTGKKGDGIFGASFKIKGTKELKTEVNPIRTITPRFVQRFLAVFKK